MSVEKEWAAIDENEEIVEKAGTRPAVRRRLLRQGEDPDEYDILAVPDTNGGWIEI